MGGILNKVDFRKKFFYRTSKVTIIFDLYFKYFLIVLYLKKFKFIALKFLQEHKNLIEH